MNITAQFSKPVSELVKKRYSCRTYSGEPLSEDIQDKLSNFIQVLPPGPFGSRPRFQWVASKTGDSTKLSDLGTYGFIKDAPGFIIGTIKPGQNNLEDFGFLMEAIILCATDLDLGTCWLGGTFTRSTFAKRINIAQNETIPAVTSVGYAASKPRNFDARVRQAANSDQRLPWENLFFNQNFDNALSPGLAGEFSDPLEMVRLGPSASNKQPWRIIKTGNNWHLYLQRTPGYLDSHLTNLMRIEDLQRVDMGIAMCHFQFTAQSLDLHGTWQIHNQPGIETTEGVHYITTWTPS